jgi:pyruvate,water dikinase
VFFLTLEEVRALVKGHLGAGAVAALIAARRNEFSHYAATPPPPERFLTRGPVAAYAAWPACLQASRVVSTLKDAQLRPGALIGLTASPGVVTAPLLVASTFEEATRVDGHILVAARTDPGWVPLFSRCKGLIIERGSALSHSAVMARELGIPTLVGVLDATTRLKSGEMATLDASGGFVELASKT